MIPILSDSMAGGGKRLLYADLFKPKKVEGESQISPSDSTWSRQISSSWDSTSSTSSFSSAASDLCFSEEEDGDFIDELTRQMAECMLRDDDETLTQRSESAPQNLVYGSSESSSVRDLSPPQVYEVKNQPPISVIKQAHKTRGGRRNANTERNSFTGSGMRAVFLPSPTTGVPGTGVFLPRVDTVPVELKKKTGCSTVLIPNRVLELLELHHNKRFPANKASSPIHLRPKDEGSREWEQCEETKKEEIMLQLPQEWTY